MNLPIRAFRATRTWLGIAAFAAMSFAAGNASAQNEQQDLVDASQATLTNFLRDPDMTWLQRHFPEAKGVVISPKVVKAGWIFGGSGGRAVVFARNAQTGKWAGPAFYNLGAASFGFQAGISVSETVSLVMTEKGLNTLLANSVKLGGDASVAAGPVGAGANSTVTADFIAFSRAKGLYGGLNLEGSVIGVANDWNKDYYGSDVLPPDILVRGTAHNAQSDRLAAQLGNAATGKTSLR